MLSPLTPRLSWPQTPATVLGTIPRQEAVRATRTKLRAVARRVLALAREAQRARELAARALETGEGHQVQALAARVMGPALGPVQAAARVLERSQASPSKAEREIAQPAILHL